MIGTAYLRICGLEFALNKSMLILLKGQLESNFLPIRAILQKHGQANLGKHETYFKMYNTQWRLNRQMKLNFVVLITYNKKRKIIVCIKQIFSTYTKKKKKIGTYLYPIN